MQLNFVNITQDVQIHVFSYLKKEFLLQTIPLVCKYFNQLSHSEILWNQIKKVDRQNFKQGLALASKYANQIAIRQLVSASVSDYQIISEAAPFLQKILISNFLACKIDDWKSSCSALISKNKILAMPDLLKSCIAATKAGEETYFKIEDWIKNSDALFDKEQVRDMKNKFCINQEFDFKIPRSSNTKPLVIPNTGNSSYLINILHMLLYSDSIRKQVKCPIDLPKLPLAQSNDYEEKLAKYKEELAICEKKIAIQQEVLQFVYASKYKFKPLKLFNYKELNSFLLHNPSVFNLRKAIFNSNLSPKININDINKKLDVADVMDLFLEALLPNCQLELEEHTTTTDFPGYEFIAANQNKMRILQIPLRRDPQWQSLEKMIQAIIGKNIKREEDVNIQRTFDPKNGIIINQDQAASCSVLSAKKVREYIQWYQLKKLPPVLVLKFDRATLNRWDNTPVYLPKDGMIDLSNYCDATKGDVPQKTTVYKIKSYVIFEGSIHMRRYASYVERNEKYYCCNGFNRDDFRGVTKDKFLSNENVYLLVLENI